MIRNVFKFALCGLLLGVPAMGGQIGWNDFSGSENWVDFTPGFGFTTDPVLYENVWFSESGGGTGGAGLNAQSSWATYFDNVPGSSQGIAANDFWGTTSLRMEFVDNDIRRVGLLLSTTPVTAWTLEAYDAGNNLLGTVTDSMAANTEAVFVGYQSDDGTPIAYILVNETNGENGNISLFDDLRFEAVPEPATLVLLAVAALGVQRRR